MCKFKRVQVSPHFSGAENNFVYTEPPGFKSLL
jgi:hypothetical protein